LGWVGAYRLLSRKIGAESGRMPQPVNLGAAWGQADLAELGGRAGGIAGRKSPIRPAAPPPPPPPTRGSAPLGLVDGRELRGQTRSSYGGRRGTCAWKKRERSDKAVGCWTVGGTRGDGFPLDFPGKPRRVGTGRGRGGL